MFRIFFAERPDMLIVNEIIPDILIKYQPLTDMNFSVLFARQNSGQQEIIIIEVNYIYTFDYKIPMPTEIIVWYY